MYDNFFGERESAVKEQLAQGGVDFGPGYNPMDAAHGMDGPIFSGFHVNHDVDWVVKKDRHSCFAIGGYHQGRTAMDSRPTAPAPPQLLENRLREADITTVLVAGCLTNCCCEATARDAMQRNFQVVMLADGCAAATDDDHNAALNSCAQIFGDVMLVDEVLESLQSQPHHAAATKAAL